MYFSVLTVVSYGSLTVTISLAFSSVPYNDESISIKSIQHLLVHFNLVMKLEFYKKNKIRGVDERYPLHL